MRDKASTMAHERVCLCLCQRPHWAPAPGPHMMGGRPSAQPALLAIHHQPAATGGMACLFCQLRVAPQDGGWRKWPFSAWAGGWTTEVCRALRAGPGWDVTGPQLGKAPHRCPRPCPALCLSLPSGTSVSDTGIFPQQLSPARSFTPAPCHWAGWAQVSAATRWEVLLSEIQDA